VRCGAVGGGRAIQTLVASGSRPAPETPLNQRAVERTLCSDQSAHAGGWITRGEVLSSAPPTRTSAESGTRCSSTSASSSSQEANTLVAEPTDSALGKSRRAPDRQWEGEITQQLLEPQIDKIKIQYATR